MQELLKSQLMEHEGLRLKAYKDTKGLLTIGYGRNIQERGITRKEAEYLLDNDIAICEAEVRGALPFFNRLIPSRQIVLLNMAYNLGINKFMKFTKMLSAVQTGDYIIAANEMLNSLWAKQVKGRAEYLASVMETGRL